MKPLILILFMFCSFTLFSQSLKISGVVTKEFNEPLVGVNVVIKGTTNGTITNSKGEYELVAPNGDETIVYRFIGYIPQEVVLTGQTNINITLAEDVTTLGDVTVTGFSEIGRSRKRLESIQSIPETVIAMNTEQIEMTGVDDMGSFLTQIPGISYGESQDPGTVLINVRGIPQIRYGHSPIALVIDGVYMADANLNVQSLFDVEQIEVVKGSQGIFYGKNAIGGAVSITTKAITNDFGGSIKIGQGNGNSSISTLSLSGPIAKDKVYFRLSANYANMDGLIKNTFLDQFVDFKTEQAVRGLLKFELNKNSSLSLTGQRSYTRGGAITFVNSNNNSDFPDLQPNVYKGSPRGDYLGEGTVNTSLLSANYEYNFSKFRLNAIASYIDVDLFFDGDFIDYGPIPDVTQEMNRGSKTFNQELRVISVSESPFQWTGGVFFQAINSPWVTNQINNNDLTDYEYSDVTKVPLTDDVNKLTSFAPFVFLEYNITKELKASIGARNEFETIENETTLLGGSKSKRSYSVLQPKLSLSYNFTKDIMLYGGYSGGFRSGGYNPTAVASPLASGGIEKEIRNESSKNIEIGVKTGFFKNRLILNGAWFSTVYTDQQVYRYTVSAGQAILGTVNIAETEITGFEVDAKIRVAKFLDVIGGYSSIDSKIVKAGVIGGFDESANNGNSTPFTLTSSWNLGLFSKIELNEKVTLNNNLSFENKGKKFWFAENYLISQEDVFQEPYTLVNARIMVDIQKLSIGIWSKNIADTKYNIEWWPLSVFGIGDIRTPSQPRTYGVDLAYRF